MTNDQFKIVGLGEILWDVYEHGKFLGGAPANFAVHCHQLGDLGIIVSRIGIDALGREMLRELESRKLTTLLIQRDNSNPTGTVQVSLDEQGQPKFRCSVNVAFDHLEMDLSLRQLAGIADAVLFGTLAQRGAQTREAIHSFLALANRAFKVYDVNIRGWDDATRSIVESSLVRADAVKLNQNELAILKEAWRPTLDDESFLRFLFNEFNLKLVALTLGADGCMLLNSDELVRTPGIAINPIDTTGCGDAFAAAMIHHYLRGNSLKEIAEASNALGAFVAQFSGATPVYSREKFEEFCRSVKTSSR
ncbi:MAG: carbohydrate kinase family protein [Candidatus Zhuqueibacterota bacterium]